MLAEIYVTSPGDKPFISSALRMQAGTATAVLLSVAAVLLSNLLT